jgi:hypothetical protein
MRPGKLGRSMLRPYKGCSRCDWGISYVWAASRTLIRRSRVALLKGRGNMDETTSTGSGTSRAASGLAEL